MELLWTCIEEVGICKFWSESGAEFHNKFTISNILAVSFSVFVLLLAVIFIEVVAMPYLLSRTTLVGIATASLLCAEPVWAQATRTWVSGVGDDVNPCSRTAPCKTFASASTKTAAGGEIDALDPAGFGTITITKGITLDGAGTMASILHPNTSGITVNLMDAASPNTVILRNLSLNGAGTPLGTISIRVVSSVATKLVIDNVQMARTSEACIRLTNTAPVTVVIRNSSLTQCATGIDVAPTGGGTATVHVDGSLITGATTGIAVAGASTVRLSNTTITGNVEGFKVTAPASIESYNNNRLLGNDTDSVPTTTYYQR